MRIREYYILIVKYLTFPHAVCGFNRADYGRTITSIYADSLNLIRDECEKRQLFRVAVADEAVDVSSVQDQNKLEELADKLDKYRSTVEKTTSDAGQIDSSIENYLEDSDIVDF